MLELNERHFMRRISFAGMQHAAAALYILRQMEEQK
jgi:hypothetical protein